MARKLVLNGPAAEAVERLARSAGVSPAELLQRALRREDEAQHEERERPAKEAAAGEPGSGLVADVVTNERGEVTGVQIRRNSPDVAPVNYVSDVDTPAVRKIRIYDVGSSRPSTLPEPPDTVVYPTGSATVVFPIRSPLPERTEYTSHGLIIPRMPEESGREPTVINTEVPGYSSEYVTGQGVRDISDVFELPVSSGRLNGMVIEPSEDGRIRISFPRRDDPSSETGPATWSPGRA